MGCCCSKHEDDRFDDRSALLAKGNTTERSVRDDELLKAKLSAVGGNGHYAKPVTTAAPSTKAASCCSDTGCSSAKKPQERVNPTVESVDLLGLDQPPSPPAATTKPKPAAAASPVKPKSPPRSSSITLPKNDFAEPVKSPVKPKATVPESPKEVLSDLMPPRPSPPPSRATSSVSAAPEPARVPSPPPVPAALEESVDLEDGDDNDGEGDGEDEASGVTSNSTVASTASTASNKSKSKKKKKKGKK